MTIELPVPSKQEIRLAENLRTLLGSKNLTIVRAAKQVGMNVTTLHNYCHGSVPRNIVKLRALAQLLGTSIEELVFGTAVSPSSEFTLEGRYEVTVKRITELKGIKK